MITTEEAKKLARELAGLDAVSHAQVLEAAAHAAGYRDWNTFSGAPGKSRADHAGVR